MMWFWLLVKCCNLMMLPGCSNKNYWDMIAPGVWWRNVDLTNDKWETTATVHRAESPFSFAPLPRGNRNETLEDFLKPSTRTKRPVFGRQQWGLPSPPRLLAQHSGTFRYPAEHNTRVKTIPIGWIEMAETIQVGLKMGDKSPIKKERMKLQKGRRDENWLKSRVEIWGEGHLDRYREEKEIEKKKKERKKKKVQTAGKGRVGWQRQGTVHNAS